MPDPDLFADITRQELLKIFWPGTESLSMKRTGKKYLC